MSESTTTDTAHASIYDLRALTAAAARKWGSKTALVFDELGERLSFDEVEERSNRIANALLDLGIVPGDRVAVMLPNQPEFPLTWLGLAKIGAILVPVNIHYKQAELVYALGHSGARAIVCTTGASSLVNPVRAELPGLEHLITAEPASGLNSMPEIEAGARPDTPKTEVYPETLVNIQYTSGTTGHPKGCMLSQFYWLRIAHLLADVNPKLTESDVMLTAQPFYYMDPQWNLASSLLAGATLVVLDSFHSSTFWTKVRDYGVTFFYCLGMMPAAMYATAPGPDDRRHRVRSISCSAIPHQLHAQLEERWGAPWYEVFGMTETGGDLAVTAQDHDELVGSGCIGTPYADRDTRIVDDDDRPLPRGEVGQLVLRGPGMMDGYYRDAEATATAFRNGWFHTGDLARMDELGRVYYVGRRKDMIRRSGENISAQEVEHAIQEHPSVESAACVPVSDEVRGEEVKAYVVLADGKLPEDVPPDELARFCERRLAYFKVPRFWSYRTSLPRTPSERVAKHMLTAEQTDLRRGAYDRVDKVWR